MISVLLAPTLRLSVNVIHSIKMLLNLQEAITVSLGKSQSSFGDAGKDEVKQELSEVEFQVTQHSNPLETSADSLPDKTESISGEVQNSDNFVMLGSKTVFKMSAL